MSDISNWYLPKITSQAIYEGIYPAVIISASLEQVEIEQDDKTIKFANQVTLFFETLQDITLVDGSAQKIVTRLRLTDVSQFGKNALNRIAHACGLSRFKYTNDFEGKTLMMGIVNNTFKDSEGNAVVTASPGYGMFSFAPLAPNAQVEFLANTYPEATEEQKKTWFKEKIAQYTQPR